MMVTVHNLNYIQSKCAQKPINKYHNNLELRKAKAVQYAENIKYSTGQDANVV